MVKTWIESDLNRFKPWRSSVVLQKKPKSFNAKELSCLVQLRQCCIVCCLVQLRQCCIVCKGVPAPPLFLMQPPLNPACPPLPFLKLCWNYNWRGIVFWAPFWSSWLGFSYGFFPSYLPLRNWSMDSSGFLIQVCLC